MNHFSLICEHLQNYVIADRENHTHNHSNPIDFFRCHYREYIDLKRNQQLLRELVSRRGLPVLDDVPSGLQQTKAILTGSCFSAPQNVAAKLMYVFDFVQSALCLDLFVLVALRYY